MTDYLMSMQIFILIVNEVLTKALKINRKLVMASLWILLTILR